MNENDEKEWNCSIRMEMDKSECDWSDLEEEEMGMDRNECIENIDANENGKQRCVVMSVIELK